MSYRTFFPDFDYELPKIDGFTDSSWGNDVCPSIYNEALGLMIYCDYADASKRDGYNMRYTVNDDGTESLLETDDLAEVLAFVADYDGRPELCRNGLPLADCVCC